MGEGFLKFKRKLKTEALLKSIFFALAAGLLPVGILLLCFKLTATPFHPAFYALIGVGLAGIGFAGSFYFLRPSDEDVARRVDGELNLREKTQTMVAYREREGEVIALQRKDAEACLAATSSKRVKFHRLALALIAPVLAFALFVTAVAVPAKATEIPFVPTPWLETALENLIREVEGSSMEEGAKEYTQNELNGLLRAVKETETVSEMKKTVISVIVNVDNRVAEVNTNEEIALTLGKSGNTRLMELSTAIRGLNAAAAEGTLREMNGDFKASETVGSALRDCALLIREALSNSLAAEDDALYVALFGFASDLNGIDTDAADVTFWIDAAFNGARSVVTAVAGQAENKRVGDRVHARLQELFDIDDEELPKKDGDSNGGDKEPETPDPDKDNPGNNEGGFGKGDLVFGSDDIVYDPVENRYVKYGEIFNRYYAAVLERLVDGEVPEDLEKCIAEYYAALLKGTTEQNG